MKNFTLKIPDTLNVKEDVLETKRNSLNSRLNANKALDPNSPIDERTCAKDFLLSTCN